MLIDEYAAPGGQIWRRRYDEVADDAPRFAPAAPRRSAAREFAASGARLLAGTSVWGAPEPGVLLLTGCRRGCGRGAIVLATGAYDRPLAFPGWTLPGVMTAGGAQALAKGQGVLPGRRVLLAGAGPFLLPVAAQLEAGGADVVAVAEATRRRDWLRAGPRMASHPGRLVDYARYRTQVRKVAWGHVIVRAEGDGRVRSATIAAAGADWAPSGRERTFEVDAVCTAYGFLPVRRARPRARLRAARATRVAHDDDMRTSVPGVFVAGEAAGDRRRRPRAGRGRAGGLRRRRGGGRARSANGARAERRCRGDLGPLRRRRAKLAGFAAILSDLFDPRPGLLGARAAGHRPVPLRGRHRRRGRRGGGRGRDDAVGAEDRHPLRPGPVPGPHVRAARRRAAAGARALQRPGADPTDPARRPDRRHGGSSQPVAR